MEAHIGCESDTEEQCDFTRAFTNNEETLLFRAVGYVVIAETSLGHMLINQES